MDKVPKQLPQALIDGVLTTFSPSNDYELATDARDDISNLAEILAQLNEVFVSIEAATENKVVLPIVALKRISRLAGLGRYMAGHWEEVADRMGSRFSREVDVMESEMEVSHG
jgi:hypothetical protein